MEGEKKVITMALKVVREPLVCMDLLAEGMEDSRRHTIETHCPLFRESPTNTSLFPLSLSNSAFAVNLVNMKHTTNNTNWKMKKRKKLMTKQK